MISWRKVVRRCLVLLLAGRLALLVFIASGGSIPAPALRIVEATLLAPLAAWVFYFGGDYGRHRRAALPPGSAAMAAARDAFPVGFRRIAMHEVKLFTSFLRWISRRGPHGVAEGDLAVRYAAGQTFVIASFLFASVIETVALALIIPWPVVRGLVLVVDLWGVYFVVALQASCIVRPHIVRADGSLLLRYGVLMEIAVPAQQIAHARLERRYDRGGPAKLHPDGSLDMGMGGQTMVTVELAEPVRFTRPLGKQAHARVLRFYAPDPASVVAAIRTTVAEVPTFGHSGGDRTFPAGNARRPARYESGH